MSDRISYPMPGIVRSNQNGLFLDALFALAQRRETWSPPRIARIARDGLSNLGAGYRILQLLRIQPFTGLIRVNPRFPFKCLIRDYLVRGFTTAERTACFLHHYRHLHDGMSAALLHRTLYQDVTLFEARISDNLYAITLCFSRSVEKEGELSFNLHVDGAAVFVLSFNIVPGWVVQSEAADVLLITRLQGARGYYRQIRLATKSLHDVGPAAMLLAALHGLAQAFGIHEMACVSAIRQSSYSDKFSSSYRSAYDDFFTELGVAKNASGFFISPIPHFEKPVSLVKQGHKLRTKEKRAFKREIAATVRSLLLENC